MGSCMLGKGQITLAILDDHRTDHPTWIQWMNQTPFTLFIYTEQHHLSQNVGKWRLSHNRLFWEGTNGKEPDSKEKKHPLFRSKERVMTHFLMSFASDDSSEPNLGAAKFFHSSFWLITSDESTLYTVHFNDSSNHGKW